MLWVSSHLHVLGGDGRVSVVMLNAFVLLSSKPHSLLHVAFVAPAVTNMGSGKTNMHVKLEVTRGDRSR